MNKDFPEITVDSMRLAYRFMESNWINHLQLYNVMFHCVDFSKMKNEDIASIFYNEAIGTCGYGADRTVSSLVAMMDALILKPEIRKRPVYLSDFDRKPFLDAPLKKEVISGYINKFLGS